ncbi:MAG: shikimate kinase [Thermoplasmatota archaeon]
MNGRAHAAITILNATATGHGCSLAVKGGVEASWQESPDWSVTGAPDDALVRAVANHMQLGPARVETTSTFPPARGLKTSSGAAAALLRAAGHPEEGLLESCVAVCRAAGVTLTGAYDDQCATTLGGCHLTDNGAMTILATLPVPSCHVAIWVPDATIPKSALQGLDPSTLAPQLEAAEAMLLEGDLPGALTLNGAAFLPFYQKAGLPVSPDPVRVAMDAGALGAGLSGTGPAVAALFADKPHLEPVEGGAWHWTVPA